MIFFPESIKGIYREVERVVERISTEAGVERRNTVMLL